MNGLGMIIMRVLSVIDPSWFGYKSWEVEDPHGEPIKEAKQNHYCLHLAVVGVCHDQYGTTPAACQEKESNMSWWWLLI